MITVRQGRYVTTFFPALSGGVIVARGDQYRDGVHIGGFSVGPEALRPVALLARHGLDEAPLLRAFRETVALAAPDGAADRAWQAGEIPSCPTA